MTPVDDGTLLTLTHREVLPEPARDFAVGWHVMLDALALATGNTPDPVDTAWASLDEVTVLYAS